MKIGHSVSANTVTSVHYFTAFSISLYKSTIGSLNSNCLQNLDKILIWKLLKILQKRASSLEKKFLKKIGTPENCHVLVRINNKGELHKAIFQVKPELSATRAGAWGHQPALLVLLSHPHQAWFWSTLVSGVPDAHGCPCPALHPGYPAMPRHPNIVRPPLPLELLATPQYADNIKPFFSCLPLFSRTMSIWNTVQAYPYLISCC